MDSFTVSLFWCFFVSFIVIVIKLLVFLDEKKEAKDFDSYSKRFHELKVLEELNIIANDEKKELKEMREKENLDDYNLIIGSSDEYYDW